MARFAKPLQGPFSPVAKHPQKHKNRPEIGRFSHFNPSAEMHPFSLFSASKAPEKWLCDAICRKKQLFPTSRSGFLILHECLHLQTAHSLARNHMDAEDIAQDVFLKIINNIDTIQTENPLRLRALIIQMTKFASIDLLRKKKHKENPNDLINDWEQFPAVTTDIEECVFSHELINMAVNFVSQMDEKYRAPLTLAVLGYRIKEIASLLGMSEANTKVRISRARHMLRAYILQEENQVEQEHDIS